MNNLTSSLEHETAYILRERYYLTTNQEQRVERKLIWTTKQYPEEVIAIEDYKSLSKKGALYQIKRLICELESPTDKCIECRYRIGQYSGDPSYLLYVIFKTRLRLKFLKLKYSFAHLNIKNLVFRSKSPCVKQVEGSGG